MKKTCVILLCGLGLNLLQAALAADNPQQPTGNATKQSGDIVIKGKKINQNASVGGNQNITIGASRTETTTGEKAKTRVWGDPHEQLKPNSEGINK